jgi:hypothetical protein
MAADGVSEFWCQLGGGFSNDALGIRRKRHTMRTCAVCAHLGDHARGRRAAGRGHGFGGRRHWQCAVSRGNLAHERRGSDWYTTAAERAHDRAVSQMVVQLVAIGEESGSLDDMLGRVGDFYEAEVDNLMDGLSSLLEPLIMAVLGVMVGGLVIAMYLPIIEL